MSTSTIDASIPIQYAQAMAPIVNQIDTNTTMSFGQLVAGLPTVTQMSSNAYNFLQNSDNAISKQVGDYATTSLNAVTGATAASNATVNSLGNKAVANYQILANNSGKQKK